MIFSELLNLLLPDVGMAWHYEPECCVKRLVCCLQGQGHNWGSYNQICLFLPYLLILLLPNVIGQYNIISWGVFCTDWIAVAKVKITAVKVKNLSWNVSCKDGIAVAKVKVTAVKFQNFTESLSVLYFLSYIYY